MKNADKVIARLKECADEIAHVDETMQQIRVEMDKIQENSTDAETLYENLRRLILISCDLCERPLIY